MRVRVSFCSESESRSSLCDKLTDVVTATADARQSLLVFLPGMTCMPFVADLTVHPFPLITCRLSCSPPSLFLFPASLHLNSHSIPHSRLLLFARFLWISFQVCFRSFDTIPLMTRATVP